MYVTEAKEKKWLKGREESEEKKQRESEGRKRKIIR
jgi:2-oxoglutarate dehydrogenase complex dehydrogenase (E1) component-like enzyme